MKSYEGSCGCGKITYTINSDIKRVVNCHCNQCRSVNGAAFSSYVPVAYTALKIDGEENIKAFKWLDQAIKYFCPRCGTPLFNTNKKYAGACMVYLGTLSDNKNLPASVNVFCDNMLEWVGGISALTNFEQGLERTKDK